MIKAGIIDIDQAYLHSNEVSIKSDLLLFDRVFFIYKESELTQMIGRPAAFEDIFKLKMNEIEELEKNGLISALQDPFKIGLPQGTVPDINLNPEESKLPYPMRPVSINIGAEETVLIDKARILEDELFEKTLRNPDLNLSDPEGFLKYWKNDRLVRQFIVRVYAGHFRRTQDEAEFIPIIRGPLNPSYIGAIKEKSDVIRIISKKMPKIDPSISISALKEFKSDPDIRSKQLALINFVNELSKGSLMIPEMEDKIDYLINDYTNRLHLHRIKYRVSEVETIVTTTGYLLENLLKLKFGEIAKMFFSFGKERIQLMQSEMDLPGKEIAYIQRANEYFSGNTTMLDSLDQ